MAGVDDAPPGTGALTSGDSTDDATPTLCGTAAAGSTVTVLDGGALLGAAVADGGGSLSFTVRHP